MTAMMNLLTMMNNLRQSGALSTNRVLVMRAGRWNNHLLWQNHDNHQNHNHHDHTQVLGMINNYQRDAGEEDDRDSGSLTLLASLAEGDQVIIITIFMRIVVVWKMRDNNITH